MVMCDKMDRWPVQTRTTYPQTFSSGTCARRKRMGGPTNSKNMTSGQSNLTLKLHRCHTQPIQLYSPLCTPSSTPQLVSTDGHVWHCPGMAPFHPRSWPCTHGDLDSHLTRGSLGPPKSTSQTAYRSVQPFTVVTERRQTYRPPYSFCSNRLHLGSAASGLTI